MKRMAAWRRVGMGVVVAGSMWCAGEQSVVAQGAPVLPPARFPSAAAMQAGVQAGMAQQRSRMEALQAEVPAIAAEARARMAEHRPEMQAAMLEMQAEAPVIAAEAQAMAAEMRAGGAGWPVLLAGVGPGLMPGLGLEPGGGGQESPGKGARAEISAKDDLFAGTDKFAKNAKEATEVNMAPDELDDVRGAHASRARGTVLNVVHSYEFERPGMYSMADVDEFRRKLDGPGWHCTVRTRDLKSGGSTDVCNKRRTDGLRESAIITVEPKELTFIHRIERGNEAEQHHGGEGDSE